MPSHEAFAAVVVLHDPEDRILFVRRSISCPKYPLHWGLPGGYGEQGEKPRNAAVREVLEETGLLINPNRLRYVSTEKGNDCEVHAFSAGVRAFAPRFNDQEHDAGCWRSCLSMPYPLAPGVGDTVARYLLASRRR